jgi:hypothetical protein
MTSSAPLTIRPATPADAGALRRLAALDSSAVPAEPVLVAEIGGELHAAVSIADGTVVADPFRRTAGTVAVLRVHATLEREQRAPRAPRLRLRRSGLALNH